MDRLLNTKILELEKLLSEFYTTKKGTKTPDLGKVLPAYSSLKKLSDSTKNLLNLWEFYKGWCFGEKLRKHPELLEPKSKLSTPKKRSFESILEEDRALDDRPRGHI